MKNTFFDTSVYYSPILILIIFAGCVLKDNESNNIVTPTIPSAQDTIQIPLDTSRYEGLLSLSVGNYWVFFDSVKNKIDTVKIVGTENKYNFLWWKLSSFNMAMSDFRDIFAIRNDTIFQRQVTRDGDVIVAKVLVPPRDTSFRYTFLVGSDAISSRNVTLHHDTITVPAGTFTQYITYVEGKTIDSLAIVPGIGVVYHARNTNSVTTKQSYILIDYYLKPR